MSKQHEIELKVKSRFKRFSLRSNFVSFMNLIYSEFQLRNGSIPKPFFCCCILETSNKSQSNLPYQMIPLPFEYITMRASHCRNNCQCRSLAILREFMLSRTKMLIAAFVIEAILCRSRAMSNIVEWFRESITPCRFIP